MIKYGDLVQYIKENHVNWNTDLFDVLRGFFDSYSQKYSQPPPLPSSSPQKAKYTEVLPQSMQQELPFKDFQEPEGGEYTQQDLLNLFST